MFLSICEGVFHIEREERGEDQHNFLYLVYQKYFPIVYYSRYSTSLQFIKRSRHCKEISVDILHI